MPNFYAIDLGTTNTVIAYANNDSIIPDYIDMGLLKINQEDADGTLSSSFELPSIVYIDSSNENNVVYGKYARVKSKANPDNFIRNSKRMMSNEYNRCIGGEKYDAAKVAELLLSRCAETIRSTLNKTYVGVGTRPKLSEINIKITVPLAYSPDNIQKTKQAAVDAGFHPDKIDTIREPYAAIIDYIIFRKQTNTGTNSISFEQRKVFIVCDVGGGTYDVCLVAVTYDEKEGSYVFNSLSDGRSDNLNLELGGADFDTCMTDVLLNDFIDKNENKARSLTKNDMNRLKNQLYDIAESIKIELSNSYYNNDDLDEEEKYSYLVKRNVQLSVGGSDIEHKYQMSLNDYYHYTEKFYNGESERNLIAPIMKLMKKSSVSEKDIDYVLLTGGMSTFPLVRNTFSQYFSNKKIQFVFHDNNELYSVAKGAALHHMVNVVFRTRDEKSVTMASKSLMLDLKGSLPEVIIKKGTVLPHTKQTDFVYQFPNPNSVFINLFWGDDEFDSHMKKLLTRRKRFRSPIPSDCLARFDITLERDETVCVVAFLKIDGKETAEEELVSFLSNR